MGRRTETTAMRANGVEFPIELTLTRVEGAGSAGFTAYIRDIAERRRKEDQLCRSENRFRQLVDSVEEYAIYMLDSRGLVVTWNAGAERIEGYRAPEVLRRKYSLFYSPDEIAHGKPDEALAVAKAEGRYQDERLRVRKDGSRYWSNTVVTALRDDQGEFYGFSVITRDMTNRKKAEEETRELQAELEHRVKERTAELQRAYHEMEAFSYSISHDLRAPLIRVDGFVHLLEDHTALATDEKGRHYLKTISDAATQMGRMIDDLLGFSLMNRAEIHKVRFKLEKVLQDVLEDLQAEVKDRVIVWKIGDFPRVCGDPALLRQAVFNLVSNALKYTRGRAEARIEIGARIADREMIFFVRDNGAGFDMKFADKLFGVFQRLHAASEFEGTGIGLANVRRIIARHGGRTWAEGIVDGGATFYFSLPDEDEEPRDPE